MSSICSSFGPLNHVEKSSDSLGHILMDADELQTLKLKDGEGLTMVEGAQRMGISKSVFGEMYKRARMKLVDMVINTKVLMIKCPYEDNDGTYNMS